MCRTNARQESDESQNQQDQGERGEEVLPKWKLCTFCTVLFADTISSVLLTLPTFFWSRRYEGDTLDYYTLYGTLLDLFILNTLRLLACFIALLWAYCSRKPESSPFQLYHPNGDRKTREELDHEALEEAWSPWIRRFVLRYSFVGEILALCTFVICIIKCLARLNVELGVFDDREPLHPLFWIALLLTCIFSVIEIVSLEHMTKLASAWGRSSAGGWMHRVASNLSIPLLSQQQREELDEEEVVEQPEQEDVRGFSDITADTSYHAQWSDLLAMTNKDAHLIAFAFVFLLLAAAAQVYIPKFTGNILDALSETFSGSDGKHNSDISVWDVPGFCSNVVKLVVASIACGVFSGLRGSIFTVVGGRVNVRLRVKLMDALLTQEVGFFDVTKTGDITSRLSSDTTLVGDQVTLNVNVFLRSLVQVIGVLAFMFVISWQLSLLAFISVPVITALSKLYGEYVRRLTKLMQKKLADGNSVSEAAIGSMTTVRSFDAAESELHEFEECMNKYLHLNLRNAIAYLGYCTCITSLPNLVTAVVLFYGGLLVRNGDMSSGQLVSFLLYLQSLSDAFGNIGYIFSSLTQAVGAADKVFELLNREPRLRTPSVQAPAAPARRGIFGRALATRRIGMLAHSNIEATKTAEQRYRGLAPSECEGAIELQDVELYYPARPQRRVLNGLSLSVRPGSVVALVGPSGSGKSSVMSLVQHLYEPSKGRVMIDGIDVHQLSPHWLSRHVSVVSQEPTLFARSVKRNIMFGLEGTDEEPTFEEIQEAARLSNAHDFIEHLPFGYETDVGERGVQLSGGQKQRVAIARALVRKPRILLLDEATSALDAESEALVQEAIDDMLARHGSRSMTVMIVAHRLSTVRNADVIFVVQDGNVVEQGSHETLIANPEGAYSNLVYRQMKAQSKLEHNKT